MHELSIATSIVDLAQEEAENRGVSIVAIHLKLGVLSGVAEDALMNAYEFATAGTALEGSRLVIDPVPIVVFCPICRERRILPSIWLFQCPQCGTPTTEILEGKELQVTALEIRQ
jgi:hydrogenase nickel incorporation protein HypA/HybF